MSDAEQTAAETPDVGPSIAEVAASVFGEPEPETVAPAAEVVAVAPAEPAKPDPLEDKVSARILANQRAEIRAARVRAEMVAERATIEKQRGEVTQMARLAEQMREAQRSPSKMLEMVGMEPRAFLEALATENEPAAIAARAVAGTKTEVEELRAELKALRAEAEAEKHTARRQVADDDYNQATAAFIEHVDAAPEKYPHLIAEYTPAELARAAQTAADQHAVAYKEKFGEYPDDTVIADYLEDQARVRAEALAERRARVGQKASAPSKGSLSDVQQVAQPATGPSPRTLTSRTASEKATAVRPWSQEQADEESLRILNAALKTG